jgi:hypothetical protein
MSETLPETFARFAEEAEFRRWCEGRNLACRAVYVFEGGSIWKFKPEDWWRFVTRAIRNNGAYNLPFEKQLRGPGKNIAIENGVSGEGAVRRGDLNRWTLTDWSDELKAMRP